MNPTPASTTIGTDGRDDTVGRTVETTNESAPASGSTPQNTAMLAMVVLTN